MYVCPEFIISYHLWFPIKMLSIAIENFEQHLKTWQDSREKWKVTQTLLMFTQLINQQNSQLFKIRYLNCAWKSARHKNLKTKSHTKYPRSIFHEIIPIVFMYFQLHRYHWFAKRIAAGLIFCCIGDAFLIWPKYFDIGMISFAIGHIFYTTAFGFQRLEVLTGAIMFALSTLGKYTFVV